MRRVWGDGTISSRLLDRSPSDSLSQLLQPAPLALGQSVQNARSSNLCEQLFCNNGMRKKGLVQQLLVGGSRFDFFSKQDCCLEKMVPSSTSLQNLSVCPAQGLWPCCAMARKFWPCDYPRQPGLDGGLGGLGGGR